MASLKEEIFHTHTDLDAPLAFIVTFCHAKTCCTKSAKGIAHTQYDCCAKNIHPLSLRSARGRQVSYEAC